MPDVVDLAAEIEGEHLARSLAAAAAPLRPGAAGECEGCDYWMPRLVDGLCGFCRDGRPRPFDWEPPVPPAANPNQQAPTIAPPEERIMSGKSIMLPAAAATAIAAVEARAREGDMPLGKAAAELIEEGLRAGEAKPSAPMAADITGFGVGELLAEVSRRLSTAAGEADALRAANERADDAQARADDAVARLAAVRSALAA